MAKHNADNIRIKREYYFFLKEAMGNSERTIDNVASAIGRFEAFTRDRDFRTFNREQAVDFKHYLASSKNLMTGTALTKATLSTTLSLLKRFFQWLATQPTYKTKLNFSHAQFFNLSEKETRIANARIPRPVPTLDELRQALFAMPGSTEIEQRNRAVFAIIMLTGARDGAVISMKIKHVDLSTDSVLQDAREVRTKFGKTFITHFFQVGPGVREFLAAWIGHLTETLGWSGDAPLFPLTSVTTSEKFEFEATGIEPRHWSEASAVRRIFRDAFAAVGLPYFNPHAVRNTLTLIGERRCETPEEYKAWSQNIGHTHVSTTFTSYGTVSKERQREVIADLVTDLAPARERRTQEVVDVILSVLAERDRVKRR